MSIAIGKLNAFRSTSMNVSDDRMAFSPYCRLGPSRLSCRILLLKLAGKVRLLPYEDVGGGGGGRFDMSPKRPDRSTD